MEAPVLIRRSHQNEFGTWYYIYKCSCGKEYTTRNIRFSKSKSCGCYQKIVASTQYGCCGKDRRLYGIWTHMHGRCYNKKDVRYKNYGAKGIIVCFEWFDVKNFFEWAYSSGYTYPLTIERNENDGNYEPSNCKWATTKEQNQHTNMSLGAQKVKIIKSRLALGASNKELREEFGVTKHTIWNIKTGKTYTNI